MTNLQAQQSSMEFSPFKTLKVQLMWTHRDTYVYND